MSKEIATRFKIFLVKKEEISTPEYEFLKKGTKSNSREFKSLVVNNQITLYYKQSITSIPKWYRDFLEQKDGLVYNSSAGALFFKRLNFNGESLLFAVCFGGADSGLDLSKMVNNFGLKIALNSSDKIIKTKKKIITKSMNTVNENSTRGMSIDEFVFSISDDILTGITVTTKNKNLSLANLTGSLALTTSTYNTINNIDELLINAYEMYLKEDYKEHFSFIDQITELIYEKSIINELKNIMVKYFNERNDRLWFSNADDYSDIDIINYTIRFKGNETNYFEVNLDNIKDFFSKTKVFINEFKDFRKIKVDVNSVNGVYTTWDLIDCIYSEIDYKNRQFFYESGRIYEITSSYVDQIEKRFNNLPVLNNLNILVNAKKDEKEVEYNKRIGEINDAILLDGKNIKIQTYIEICDIFIKSQKAFVHVKNYSKSSVLSHLFNQAFVSASLFKSDENRGKILSKIKEIDSSFDEDNISNNYSVILGIISKEKTDGKSHVNLPFFSKITAVDTIERIKILGFNEVGISYIYREI